MSATLPAASNQALPSPARALGAGEDDPLRGIALVSVAMASFAVSDAISKHLSVSLAAVEIAWLRWVGFALIMAPVIAASRGAVLRSRAPGLQALRTLGILGSAGFFIAGLRHLPLPSASAIAFAAPLIVTALSVRLLGEKVDARRWAAVLAGLVGVVIVIRPGIGPLGAAAILPLLSALCWALGMIVTRKLGAIDGPTTTMSHSALGGLLVLSLLVPSVWVTPAPGEVGLAAVMALASTGAQFLVVKAYRLARASVLAPISYSQLIWSSLLGLLVFGAPPDGPTLLGSFIIIGSGLYTAHRERIEARRSRPDRTRP